MIRANPEQCAWLAQVVKTIRVRREPWLVTPSNETERHREANYWFYIVAICQNTKSFAGTIGGRWYRGWDYLCAATRRCLDDFSDAQIMLRYSSEDLRRVLSDDFNPTHSTIDRVEERVRQLHECARGLLERYEGQAMNIYYASGGRLRGEGGLLEKLAAFPPYADPLQKKSVLLAGLLDEIGIWPLADRDTLKVAMDYHAVRVALRTGMVEVTDAGLARALKAREPVSDEVNHAVRRAVSEACDLIVAGSGMRVFDFDKYIWQLGRSCCFYEHEPICGNGRKGVPCFKRERCTFIQATTYECPNVCPFDGVCKGSRDPEYRAYWETNVYTEYY
ncbi:MAG: hypothetical protein H5T64_12930 [Chloroflexi bacterium]|nr:hypothetical protein [Chloroflexota bacterium]